MTRAKKATELWERLRRGPILEATPGRKFTPTEALEAYRRWVDSWVLSDVASLVPELRSKLDFGGYTKTEERADQYTAKERAKR